LGRHCKGKRIERSSARECGGGPRTGTFDSVVIAERMTERRLASAIVGRTVDDVHRMGKYLWLHLSGSGPHLVFHCGLTGSLSVDGIKRFSFQSFSVDEAWPPRFTKLLLELGVARRRVGAERRAGTVRVAFADPRRFGRVLLRGDPMREAPCSELAADPIVSPLPLGAFAEGLSRAKAPVKAVLLDQGRVVCGVGNWIADEALHLSRLHPAAPACTLSPRQVRSLRGALLAVVRAAVAVGADATRFPRHWLFHKRWGALPEGLRATRVCGRTTVFAPTAQMGHGALRSRRTPERLMRRPAAAAPTPSARKRRRS